MFWYSLMDDIIKGCRKRTRRREVGKWRLKPVTWSALAFADVLALLASSDLQINLKVKDFLPFNVIVQLIKYLVYSVL